MESRFSKALGNKSRENSQHLCRFSLGPMLSHATTHLFLSLGGWYSYCPHYLGEKTEVQRQNSVCNQVMQLGAVRP